MKRNLNREADFEDMKRNRISVKDKIYEAIQKFGKLDVSQLNRMIRSNRATIRDKLKELVREGRLVRSKESFPYTYDLSKPSE